MTILIDSASLDDLAEAHELGFVGGFTTNPILMARETADPLRHFGRLLARFPTGPAFYQPVGDDAQALCEEARAAAALSPQRVVIKAPASLDGARAAAELVQDGVRCSLTAAYTPAQALVAHEVGCEWAIAYVDRADRLGIGGIALVEAMARMLQRLRGDMRVVAPGSRTRASAAGSDTRVLAASLKSAEQVTDAILHGADDVTASLEVLRSLASHPLSDTAIAEFAAARDAH